MRNALTALAASLLCAVGSLIGADPIITTASVLLALVRCGRAVSIGRRYVVPIREKPVRHLYPYRLQCLR